VTEKEEHLQDLKDLRVLERLSRFARERHQQSPLSSMEAHSHRRKLRQCLRSNADLMAYVQEQARLEEQAKTTSTTNSKE
jgi:hypothetical protein